ncbi:MAG: hypothetical protein WCX46_04705 [Candidatus Paceibacterota bacterium]
MFYFGEFSMIIKLNSKEKKYKVILSKKDWVAIGKEGGWLVTSQLNEEDDDVVFDAEGNPTWKSEVSPEVWEKAKYESEFHDLERDEAIEKMYEETNALKEKFENRTLKQKQTNKIPSFIKARIDNVMYDVVKQIKNKKSFTLVLQDDIENRILKINVPNYSIWEGFDRIDRKSVQLFMGSSDSPEPFIFPLNVIPKQYKKPSPQKDIIEDIKKEKNKDNDDDDIGNSSNYNRYTHRKLLGFTFDGKDYFITSKRDLGDRMGFFTGDIEYKVKSNDGETKVITREMVTIKGGQGDFVYTDENNRRIKPELIEKSTRYYETDNTEVETLPH